MLNYRRDELLKLRLPDLRNDVLYKTVTEMFKNFSSDNLPRYVDTNFYGNDGTSYPVEISFSLFQISHARLCMIIVQDISRFKSLKNFEKEKKELGQLLENFPDFISRYDRNCRRIYVNTAMEKLFNKPRNEIINTTPELFSPADDHELLIRKIRNTISEGIEQTFEMPYHTVQGESRVGHILIVPEYNEEKNITGATAIGRDITELKRVEAALRESEAKFFTVFRLSPIALAIIRLKDENFLDVNESFLQQTGLQRTDVVGGGVEKNPFWIDNKWKYECFRIIQERGGVQDCEFEFRNVNGSVGAGLLSAKLISIKNEPCILLQMVGITERKLAENALRESENRYHEIFNNASDSLYLLEVTEDGHYVNIDVNPAFEKSTGISRKVLIGKTIEETFPEETAKKIIAKCNACVAAGVKSDYEVELELPAGKRIFHSTLMPVQNDKGRIDRIVGISRDITESKRVEENVRVLKRSIEQSPVVVVITNKFGIVEYVNPKFTEVTGYTLAEVIGKNPTILKADNHQKEIHTEFWDTISGGREWSGKFLNKKKTGELYWLSGFISRVKDEKGETTHYVGIMEDITEKIKSEEELVQYRHNLEELVEERTDELNKVNKLLQKIIAEQKENEKKIKHALEREQEMNELRARFISTASHEFRTPLTTVLSSTQLLEKYGRRWDEEMYKNQLNRIKEYVQYLVEILDDVLLLSKAETQKLKFNPREIDLAELASRFIEDVKTLLLPHHNLKHTVKLKKKKYFLDEKLLKYIVSNLLSNSVKYSPEGGEIEFKIIEDDNRLHFMIKDNGIGIPEEDQRHLFEPFFRGKNVGEIKGTGLGMSIIKRAVELHKGNIEFKSEPGRGAVFTVSIQLREI
ncbi:MAG: PAS domain S-box protein [Ignavibacteriales bacterium]|nr:PAS domain S-box protein [Ignavibacteriales bacterium]